MLKQRLQQKLLQKLSPQQIQLIKLLEVPTMQLEQRIKKEIEENPILEEGREDEQETTVDEYPEKSSSEQESENESESEKEVEQEQTETVDEEFSLDDYLNEGEDTPNYKLSTNNYSKDDDKKEIPYSGGISFHEHLEGQLGLRILSDEQKKLAEYVLGNIDDDGYLRRDIEAIVDDLAFSQNIMTSDEELGDILKIIQDFDPAGVGARDLQECLLIQIRRTIQQFEITPSVKLAQFILKEHFEEFTKKHYDKIISRLNIAENELKDAIDEILRLNPKPGSSFADSVSRLTQHIIPDFLLEVNNDEFELQLNSKNAPELRISQHYANMLEGYTQDKKKKSKKEKEAISFVKQKLDSAKWFIDAIKQRQNTLMLTMNAIINYQKEYFADGDETTLRPMILKDIAEKTNLDISTISRVANSKYIQTHFGIFPLKFFFSEGMQTDSGEEVSTREIKKILQNCIGSESKRKPLTDEKLSIILQEKGYQIARRTVAKYREQLSIPVARLRKKL